MEWFVQSGAMLESSMNQVERIQYYTATPPEAPLSLAPGQTWDAAHKCIVQRVLAELAGYDEDDGDRDDREWPSEGRIEFNNVWLRYRDDLGHVLQGISLTIDARHKVGVVGRTGAGKSSLINALFRLVELDSGTITIDGRDISRLGLHQACPTFLFSLHLRWSADVSARLMSDRPHSCARRWPSFRRTRSCSRAPFGPTWTPLACTPPSRATRRCGTPSRR
jgi:hypothetical protein